MEEPLDINLLMPDGGPVYAETNPDQFIVEPWNAVSSLTYLFPALFWAVKLYKNYKSHIFITFCIPLLVIGGIGSALYHAFRSSGLLLALDVGPILILTLAATFYLWNLILKNPFQVAILILLPTLAIQAVLYFAWSGQASITLLYLLRGIFLLSPLVILLIKTRFYRYLDVALSVFLFALSLIFREIDSKTVDFLPMGAHFLWHAFSAAGAFFLAQYLYFYKKLKPAV